jgi:hypothetical protein
MAHETFETSEYAQVVEAYHYDMNMRLKRIVVIENGKRLSIRPKKQGRHLILEVTEDVQARQEAVRSE